jgi:hypothetical protein
MSYPDWMSHERWVSGESRMTLVARQVFARAWRQRRRVLVVALLATGAYVALRARRAPSYEATLYFRLAEGDLTDPNTAPRPPSAIREYISRVALSRDRAEAIMKKYGWSGAYLARNRVAAIDEFREEIRIVVDRNYFIYDRRPGDPPRSAQVTISAQGSDAEQTRAMLREIGDAILQEQAAQRSGRLAQARDALGAHLTAARVRTKSLREQIGRLSLDLPKAGARGATDIRAQIAALQAETQGAVEQMLALERRVADVAFSAAAEGKRLGLDLELFDESVVASAPDLTPFQLSRLTALVFMIALLLTMPVVGAFDDRIYTPEDLAARGLPLFGALPHFPGDDEGAYRARRQTMGV